MAGQEDLLARIENLESKNRKFKRASLAWFSLKWREGALR